MKPIFAVLTLSLLFSFCSLLYSQENKVPDRLVLGVEPRWGFVAPHHDYMSYFLEKNILGVQINVGLLTQGTKDWHVHFNYPQIGAGFYHSGLGNARVYGQMDALYLYVDRKFLPIQNRFNIGNRVAFGLSHINKQYNKYSNPYNMAIATAINVFIQYDLAAYYRITPAFNVRVNAGLTHTSNGSIREPNKGFNLVTAGVGLQYSFSDGRLVYKSNVSVQSEARNNQLNIGVISGFKAISRFDNEVYSVVGLSGEYLYQLNSTAFVGIEITGYWDTSIKDEFKMEDDGSYRKTDNLCIAINPSYALQMGKVYFTFQPGFYLKNSFKPYGLWTNKVGLRYQLTQNIFASIAVKAHWLAKADFVEFGVRYNIFK